MKVKEGKFVIEPGTWLIKPGGTLILWGKCIEIQAVNLKATFEIKAVHKLKTICRWIAIMTFRE